MLHHTRATGVATCIVASDVAADGVCGDVWIHIQSEGGRPHQLDAACISLIVHNSEVGGSSSPLITSGAFDPPRATGGAMEREKEVLMEIIKLQEIIIHMMLIQLCATWEAAVKNKWYMYFILSFLTFLPSPEPNHTHQSCQHQNTSHQNNCSAADN